MVSSSRLTSVMTATTEVVISEKSMLELASVELSGTEVSRISTMRMGQESLQLFDVNAGGLYHFIPSRHFRLDALGKFARAVSDRHEAERVEFFPGVGIGDHF